VSTAMTDLTRIDDGPVATVYSGHHAGVPVALKVFPKRFDKRTMSAFTTEQAKLATVSRVTSILMVAGVEELVSGEPALRMELCTQSLAGLVERVGPLAAADVVVLGRAVAVALAAAHGAGVVHGGISPSNVLFRNSGEPVVGDFGVVLRQAFTRDPLHAIEYLPPETLRTGTLNEATDLYGLGAVLHFALSGRSPHPGRLGEQPGERVLRILGEPVPAINRPDVPIGLSTLVARLLATTPDRRPPDATQVADQLAAMLPNSPQTTTQEDWDDFDTPPAPAPVHQPTPRPQPKYTPEDPLDFDDFAFPAPHRPGPPSLSPPAPPHLVGPRFQRPAPPAGRPIQPRPQAAPAAVQQPVIPTPVGRPPIMPEPPQPVPPAGSPVASQPQVAVPPAAAAPEQHPVAPLPIAPAPELQWDGQPAAAISPPAEPVAAAADSLWDEDGFDSPPSAAAPESSHSDGVLLRPEPSWRNEPPPVTEEFALPTVAFPGQPQPAQPQPGVVLDRPSDLDSEYSEYSDFGEFGDFGDSEPRRGSLLAGPLAPPGQSPKRTFRYDLLAGAALLLALLALVPLLLLRGDPEEINSTPKVPAAGNPTGVDVQVELAAPTDLTDKVELNWHATRDFDFAVVIAEDGEKTQVLLAERNHSMTVDVKPGKKYCFLVQASDGGPQVYESNPVPLRGASCRKK